MRFRRTILGIAVAMAVVSSVGAADAPVMQSGKPLDIISIAPLQSSQGWSALVLTYRTAIPLTELEPLHREADEVWNHFVVDAERGKYRSALISATQAATSVDPKQARSYNFAYQKQGANWRGYDFKPGEASRLDEGKVRNTIARFDAALDRNEINAVMLYLGDNWSHVLNMANDGKPFSGTLNRVRFIELTARTLARVKDFQHTRRIARVTIAPDGQSAEIASEETESGTLDGRPVNQMEQTIDRVGIEGASIVLTKTVSTEMDAK